MKKTLKILVIAIVVIATGCSSPGDDGTVSVKVKAVEQVENYTYLLVKGKGPAYWIAVTSTEIAVGEKITYQGGMLMENFYSKELDKTFEKVIFLDGMEGSAPAGMEAMPEMPGVSHGSSVKSDKLDITVEAEEGTITIAELFANPGAYDGKTIRIKGEVAKFNPAIMERNWIHLQDGSEYEGKYDLTVTSQESFQVGQVLTVEGILALNRDFGYGYSYEILLEEATIVK
ncbi:MAG: hypothetical protein U9R49_07900 [Bacteroidota bacterium]|nr:hypothetical protein [Bacteroidota bacterium]